MDQLARREPLFQCEVCLLFSYFPMLVIDFGAVGSYPIPVCGDCMTREDKTSLVLLCAVNNLKRYLSPKIIVARIYEVLAEFHELPQQGS